MIIRMIDGTIYKPIGEVAINDIIEKAEDYNYQFITIKVNVFKSAGMTEVTKYINVSNILEIEQE